MLNLLKQNYLPLFIILCFYYTLILSGNPVSASPVPENPEEISWHISAMKVTFDKKRNLYIAQESVVITGGRIRLEADYIEFSNDTKDAAARGNVILISGEDSISCNAMTLNLETQTGVIDKGTIFMEKNHFYIRGEDIKKRGPSTYSAKTGSVTSCKGDSPDWKITGENINVTVQGYGSAANTILWAKQLPAFYTPYLIFPVKTQRQTGLLFPRITTSERKGIELEQPLFIAISKNADASIYTDYMSERGVKLGTEFRYILNSRTKGSVYFDFLEDQKNDDGTDQTENYSFSSTPRRTNQDRFWFRMKHNQELPEGFDIKLDIDVVSDEDYLHEFKSGFTGYNQTKAYFENEFGRSIDEYDDHIRKNWFNISKSWSSYLFNAEVLWYDNIRSRQQDEEDTTLQTLPALEFDAAKQQIAASGLFYSLDSEFRSFYREDTTDALVTGQRTDIYPKIYLPIKLGNTFYFEPSVGGRQTMWFTTDFTDINGSSDNFRTREIYDIGAALSTKLNKIFTPDSDSSTNILHEVIPRLEYEFTPDILQEDLPYFDTLDRVEGKNQVTWSLTNYFISRKSTISDEGKERIAYDDLAYFKLYQTWDIKKEQENESEPFSDIFLDMELNPWNFLHLDLDLAWSPYDNHFNTLNIGNTLKNKKGDSIRSEYRYLTGQSESLYSEINLNITDELSSFCSIEHNLKEKKSVETRAGLTLKKSCWTLDLYFSQSPDETTVSFLINLHGIGEFGTK